MLSLLTVYCLQLHPDFMNLVALEDLLALEECEKKGGDDKNQ